MEKKNSLFNRCVILITALFLFYYSYRYILKYNSETTSPTYSDTPALFKYLKYALLFILIISLILSVIFKKIKIKLEPVSVLLLVILLETTYFAVICHSINSIIFFVFMFLITIIYIFGAKIDERSIDKLMNIYLYFTIIYEALQLFLYFSTGRLPALAYQTGILSDVRFGGAIDDPNGFGILLSFFIPFVFIKHKGMKRFILLTILLVFLLLTWSLTAIFSFGAAVFLYLAYKFFKENRLNTKSVTVLLVVFVLIITILALYLKSSFIKGFLERKSASIVQHMDGFIQLKNTEILTILGIKPNEIVVESGLVRIINYGGILLAITFYSLGFYAISRANYLAKHSTKFKYLYKSFGFYLGAFIIASINLPMIDSFINFGFYSIIIGICLANYKAVKENISYAKKEINDKGSEEDENKDICNVSSSIS